MVIEKHPDALVWHQMENIDCSRLFQNGSLMRRNQRAISRKRLGQIAKMRLKMGVYEIV